MSDGVSRRDFYKTVAAGALGGLAATSVSSLAAQQRAAEQKPAAPKRMTTILRELINGPGIIAAPGIYDPLTARIAESLGFQVLDLPGSAVGYATAMMEPNLTLENMAEATRAITSVVNIPVVVDVGAGYGEPAHILHTVRLLENAGAACIHLEDQIFPKRFHYHVGSEHTVPVETVIEKIHYAIEARRDPDFIIVGRTDAIRTVGFAEGVRRANLYFEAGADMVMPSHSHTAEQVRQLPKEVNGPINWTQSSGAPGEAPIFSLQELDAMAGSKGRYKMINYVNGPILASFKAVRDMLKHLKETGEYGRDPMVDVAIRKDLDATVGLAEYIRIENATTEKGA